MKKLVTALAAAIVLMAGAPAAHADSSIPATPSPAPPANPTTWHAEIGEASGMDSDSLDITTSGACPDPAAAVIGRIFGEGFPAKGVNVIGNQTGGVSQIHGFQVGLQQSLRDTRQRQPEYEPYKGTYTIVVSCIVPAYSTMSYGDYTVKIKFTDQHHWIALPPVSNIYGPVRLSNGQYVPADSPLAQNPNVGPGPVPGASGSPTPMTHPSPAAAKAASQSSGMGWGIWLIIAGIAIAAVVVIVFRPKAR